GAKVEVKNLNSFRYLRKAIEFEIERHINILESHGHIAQETRLWNQTADRTESMRSKEKAHDYRYFPEPDLLPVHLTAAWRAEILGALPELPEAKRTRFVAGHGITPYDAGVLTSTPALAAYFEAAMDAGAPAKAAANWLQTELLRRLKDAGKEITGSPVCPSALAELVKLVESGVITAAVGKKIFATMFETGRGAAEIAASGNLGQSVDSSALEHAAAEVIRTNPENVVKFKAGNEGVFKYFVGQVMRATHGQADPQAVNEALRKLLS
ncbi:MAG: Asp-tRNA(Asn)/Glu-tRNA(Gln) amidotransferase subunit GatB, partial [Candidatus Acidiferrum sp.]